MKPNKFTLGLLALLILLLVWFLQPEKSTVGPTNAQSIHSDDSFDTRREKIRQPHRIKRRLTHAEALAQELPQGVFEYVFDKAPGRNQFLLAKGHDEKFLPDSDAVSGMDLQLQDESGNERLIHDSVTRAKFSPDGSKIAFTTSDCVLHVQDLQGTPLAEFAGVYGPSWKPDGSGIIFSKVGEGHDPHRPGPRQLTALDLATGEAVTLTDGGFDDGRPEFNPISDSVIFVSGARSGLASFWMVPATGGEAVQLTNTGLQEVNAQFVPTPYDKTLWSGDKRWFLYDFKNGDQQETWGLEFNSDGTLKNAAKLSEGLNPRWQQDGSIFVCEKIADGKIQTIVSHLP